VKFCRISAVGYLLGPEHRSILGFQVQVKFAVGISVGWSVTFWASVLYSCLKAVVASALNLKETLMNTLHATVLVGAALLPVPGW